MQGISAQALLSLRADMLRFAQLQVRNAETAEDLVQMKALRQVMQAYAEGRAPSVEPERGVPD